MTIDATLYPALITASAAFLAGAAAQIISHWLTKNRENVKYQKEIFQSMFAPILLDVYFYIDVKTDYRKAQDVKDGVDEEVLKGKIIEHIGENLKYASPRLISAYESVKMHDYFEDYSGIMKPIDEVNLLFYFLEDLYEVNKKAKILDRDGKVNLVQHQILYGLWSLIAQKTHDFSKADRILMSKFLFKKRTREKHSVVQKIKKLIGMKKYNFGRLTKKTDKILFRLVQKKDKSVFKNILKDRSL